MIYLSLLFIVLASICNSIMDTSVHHYSTSIFKKLNPLWWDGETSWRNKYIDGDSTKGGVKWYFGLDKPVQLTDAFHFFKMWMIIFISLSIVLFDNSVLLINNNFSFLLFSLFFITYGVLWNSFFSLFYNRILRKK